MDKAWKAYERWVAKLFETTRIPVRGDLEADVAGLGFWIDCKLRKEVPISWQRQVDAAEVLGYNMVALQDVVIARVSSIPGFINLGGIVYVDSQADLPVRPYEWLDHIRRSCPENFVSSIAMCVPRSLYSRSIMVMDKRAFSKRLGG